MGALSNLKKCRCHGFLSRSRPMPVRRPSCARGGVPWVWQLWLQAGSHRRVALGNRYGAVHHNPVPGNLIDRQLYLSLNLIWPNMISVEDI